MSFSLNQKLTIFFSLHGNFFFCMDFFWLTITHVFVQATYTFLKSHHTRKNLSLVLIWMELNLQRTGPHITWKSKTLNETKVLLILPSVCQRARQWQRTFELS
jgi:hypothetical protein